MNASVIGAEIRRLCLLAGYGAEGLAAKADVNAGTVRRTMSGETSPRATTLKKIEDVFIAEQLIRPRDLLGLLQSHLPVSASTGSQAQLATRAEVDVLLGTVESRFAAARKEILISGNDCKLIVESLSGELEEALRRKVRVRVLVVDPHGLGAQALPYLDPRFPTVDSFIKSMAGVSPVLERLKTTWRSRFDYRYLPFVPPTGLFMVDKDDKEGLVKVEVYCVKPYLPLQSRPHLVLSDTGGSWRQYFIQQWQNQWKLARRPDIPAR